MIPPPLYPTMAELQTEFWLPAVTALAAIGQRGVWVDRERAEDTRGVIEDELCRLENEWERLAPGVPWRSPKELNAHLYDRLGLPIPPVKGSKGTPEINEGTPWGKPPERNATYWALRWLETNRPEHAELARCLRRMKSISRVHTNYLGALLESSASDGRARPRLSQRAATGRVTCAEVPLQQFTRPDGDPIIDAPRGCVAAPPGRRLIGVDLPSAEWRGTAQYAEWFTGDRRLLEEVAAGVDPHNGTGVEMFELPPELAAPGLDGAAFAEAGFKREREIAKVFNYQLLYGKSEHGYRGALVVVSPTCQPASPAQTRDYMRRMQRARPSVFRTIDAAIGFGREHGGVRTISGRWRQLPELRSKCPRHGFVKPDRYCRVCVARGAAERQALNSIIQGFVADLANLARLQLNTCDSPELVEHGWYCAELADLGWAQVLEVHDELLFEGPEATVERAAAIIAATIDGLRGWLCDRGIPWEPAIGPARAIDGASWLVCK